MDIAKIILEIRREHSLSQDDMAQKLFVTRQAVSRWETGETTPSIDTLKQIAKVFGVPASKLLGLPQEPICQSCGMDLKVFEDFGTNSDGGIHTDYCKYCIQKGSFTHDRTLDEMVEFNLKFLDEYNKEKGTNFTPAQARTELKQHLATLKRWKS